LQDSAAAEEEEEEEGVEEEEEAWRGTHRRSSGRPMKVLDVCTGSGVQVGDTGG
jgi:methylase of polypeptide subunit release factors